VESIVNHRVRTFGGHWNTAKTKKVGQKKVTEYLVHWKGYGVEDRTWEPESNCNNCPDLVHQYWKAHKLKAKAEQDALRLKLNAKQLKRLRHTH
jgi:hypothetical protein